MNDLYSFQAQHRNTRVMHKWDHYFEIYERFLSPIRRSNPVVVEIGVQLGGSVEMWRDYFGPATRIFGIDINPEAKQQEDIVTRVFVGDQHDRAFLRSVLREIGAPDVVIDDGGHITVARSFHGPPRPTELPTILLRPLRPVDGMDKQAGELRRPGH